MRKRLTLIALVLIAPVLMGAARMLESKHDTKTAVAWIPAGGPVDPAAVPDATEADSVQGLTVHEWGTFTSVAGPNGNAIEWLPAGGPTDLPCFVNLFGSGPKGLPPTGQGGRANKALVRMETPVLYFYSPKKESVSVRVSFPHGLITEWFPNAALVNAFPVYNAFPKDTSVIEWNDVKVMPGDTKSYQIEEGQSHYYAARRTSSAPLQVGKQFEKFLFYRGIASFQPPLAARLTKAGDGKIRVENLGAETIPNLMLFENRGGKIGYRIHKGLSSEPVILDPPSLTQTFESLQRNLEAMLREQGMYALEARAMVDTWRDSWFEQGTRIFYIVPSKTVDAILPLEINPKPVDVARAFVGRMEVFTPATLQEVTAAIDNNDQKALETYSRFLEPVLHDFLQDYRADGKIASMRAAYVDQVTACSKQKTW